jgi:hypothetical protein
MVKLREKGKIYGSANAAIERQDTQSAKNVLEQEWHRWERALQSGVVD